MSYGEEGSPFYKAVTLLALADAARPPYDERSVAGDTSRLVRRAAYLLGSSLGQNWTPSALLSLRWLLH